MAEITIKGTIRTEFGKGPSRKARRDGLVPAVIYGHGEAPTHISLPAREVGIAIKTANVLLDIDLGSKTELVLPKSIVRNPLKGTLEHLDLVIVRRGEKVIVAVPVHATGEFDRDGILEHVNNTIEVEAEATAIPAFLELDMTGLMAGESKYAADVVLPAGITLVSDLKMTVVHLSVRAAQEEVVVVAPVEGDAAAATAAAPAEGEAAKEEKK
ncbi:MAG: 50S ribosomal protein L25/general stress protein Ctc [Actinobacteria bacterium]|jgi:large subunit ribosomal protein L25|nr:50S ribosomal protein L25/general stress protein Ctc [Actinomycetota bacterium]NDH13263.1 50S ribosomal protein L25/general stress protein Ctc [Actinomycetota bacterium]